MKVQGDCQNSSNCWKVRAVERLNYWALNLSGLYCIRIAISMYHLNESNDANYINQTTQSKEPYWI